MRIAYFDCFAGIAGDMTVAALLDAGLDFAHLESELRKLGVRGYQLRKSRTERHHIAATRFEVLLEAEVPYHTHGGGEPHRHQGDGEAHHHHGDGDAHQHGHHHSEKSEGNNEPDTPHVHRRLRDVVEIITGAKFSPLVEANAVKVFTRLAEAEAKVHGTDVDSVHFHEVGAVDAIVDIVGACIGLEALGVERVFASTIRTGTGTVRAAHGMMPVPAPGTLELLRGVPQERTTLPFELVTPTGAALITTFCDRFGAPPAFTPELVGYGAGTKDFGELANLLRVEIGTLDGSATEERGIEIETTIDDMTPEVYGYVIEKLFKAGARDVYLAPVIMKKNRPGIVVHVLTEEANRAKVEGVLFAETTTLGVRSTEITRRVLPRRSMTVVTPWGSVRIKVAEWNGQTRFAPEYDDCAVIARQQNVPILEVYDSVRKSAERET